MTNEEAKRIVRDVIRFNNGFAQAHGKAGDLDADAILTALTAPGEGLREAIRAFSDELDDWTNERPVPPVDFMTMQFGPKMVAAWDRVIRALAAPAPQEQAQCPSCDGLLDTAGCTCPAPPASAPEGDGA